MKKSYILLIGLVSAILALILIPLFFYYASQVGYFFLHYFELYESFLLKYFGDASTFLIMVLTFIVLFGIFLATFLLIVEICCEEYTKKQIAEFIEKENDK